MASRTSGGLIKRSMTFDEGQLRVMEQMASERHTSTAAIMRELIALGLKVHEVRRPVTQPAEEMAVEIVAREVA